jgi:hypothetical protein
MAVCCQNLTLSALSGRSTLSVLVGALFKKFGLFLNTPRIIPISTLLVSADGLQQTACGSLYCDLSAFVRLINHMTSFQSISLQMSDNFGSNCSVHAVITVRGTIVSSIIVIGV